MVVTIMVSTRIYRQPSLKASGFCSPENPRGFDAVPENLLLPGGCPGSPVEEMPLP
ncbi:hypothetical protein ASZ90_009964 [hydrocarbon metagenome]|uniref:Uncharacterized protein n=1 Tax=hydrocarbon metagenome TaxID=938273 RepID=A0A0W8FHH4_9ZZZZ